MAFVNSLEDPLANPHNFELVSHFVRLGLALRNEIDLHMPARSNTADPPPALPPHIETFLMQELLLDTMQLSLWWNRLKTVVWSNTEYPLSGRDISALQTLTAHKQSEKLRNICK